MTIMRKLVVAGVLTIGLAFSGINKARAQESENSSSNATSSSSISSSQSKTADAKPPISPSAYRFEYSINELEDGKRINTRHYSLNVNENDNNELKVGTRIPVEVKEGQVEYIDVGTNVSGRTQVVRGDSALKVFVHVDMSSFAVPEQANGHDRYPAIRQLKIGGSTIAEFGKPMMMGTVDDPNSKRQFQLELTVTKLK